MSIVTDGLRSDKWRPFARQKMQMLKDLGLSVKSYVIDGYRISLSTMDDMDKARITAPPGAVVVDRTAGNYEYRYADQYGGDFATLLSRPASAGFIPLTPFSAVDDLVYLATSDYAQSIDTSMTFAGSWYAPRPTIPADPTASAGFLAGLALADENSARQTLGYAFARNGTLYVSSQTNTTPSNVFAKSIVLGAVRNAGQVSSGFDISAEYPEYKGQAFFSRPVWGEDAAMTYVFHIGADCSGVLGRAQVRSYYLQITAAPLAIATSGFTGAVTQAALATALGLAAPCAGDDTGAALASAMDGILAPTWPENLAPYSRGMFAHGVYDMCVWGPMPNGTVKGLVLSFDGTASVIPVTFPPHNDFALYPLTTEVSPGHYCCELWTTDGVSDTGEISKVYYGSPLTGAWVELPHPPGVILRHRTIQATTAHTIALAVMYDTGAAETVLHEYDSRKSTEWRRRGKIGVGKITRPHVALFGDHEYTRMASTDSSVARLWD